jgi:hypothetical protein
MGLALALQATFQPCREPGSGSLHDWQYNAVCRAFNTALDLICHNRGQLNPQLIFHQQTLLEQGLHLQSQDLSGRLLISPHKVRYSGPTRVDLIF